MNTYTEIKCLNIDIKWSNRIISEYSQKKSDLKEQLKSEKSCWKIRSIKRKIKRYKTIVNGFVQYIVDCKSQIKQLQRQDPNNIISSKEKRKD